jgi:hypothetical protein
MMTTRFRSALQQLRLKRSLNRLRHQGLGDLLVASKNGLYLIDNDVTLLRKGEFYGIAIHDQNVFVFQRNKNQNGYIVRFKKDLSDLTDPVIITDQLDWGCHQMDWFDGYLYLTDTFDNSIIKLDEDGEILERFYPVGELTEGRESSNYAHINSLFFEKGEVFLLFHNDTSKTGRNTEIVKTNRDFVVNMRHVTKASHGHNIVCFKDDLYYCDSQSKTLMKNDHKLFQADLFTRGLSILEQFIVLGGSEYAQREDRNNVKGKIYILDHRGNLKIDFTIPGMVQEIRCLTQKDYALSMNNEAI